MTLSRRDTLKTAGAALMVSAMPGVAIASVDEMEVTIKELFGDREITQERVNLKIPPIAENGYSVSMSVDVDSPMTEEDYVKRIVILSERNPIPLIASYHLTPRAGRAKVSSRVRLAGTQTLWTIAEMNDGRLFSGSVKTVVTVAACVIF